MTLCLVAMPPVTHQVVELCMADPAYVLAVRRVRCSSIAVHVVVQILPLVVIAPVVLHVGKVCLLPPPPDQLVAAVVVGDACLSHLKKKRAKSIKI